jgi:uncharacterized membrane protein YfcA
VAKIALSGAIPGAILGAFIVSQLDDQLDFVFKVATMLVVGWANYKTWKKMRPQKSSKSEPDEINIQTIPVRIGAGFGGLASSSLAIGAGAIYIPVLHQYGGLRSRTAIGTSFGTMMFVVPMAIISHALFLQGQLPDLIWLFTLPIAVFVGATSGARLGMRLNDEVILKVFLGLLAIIFVRYAMDIGNRIISA